MKIIKTKLLYWTGGRCSRSAIRQKRKL